MESKTASEFNDLITSSKKPVLVDFWAPWCGPCRLQTPILEKFSEDNASSVTVVKINVDDEQELAGHFNIMSIPTLIIFKDGKELTRSSGLHQKDALQALLKKGEE